MYERSSSYPKTERVRNDYQANKMFSSADDVHQLSSFGKDINLMRSSWEINQSQDENIRRHRARKNTYKGLSYNIFLLEERRKQLTKRILTGGISEMLNSHKNYATVKEEIMKFDVKFELLLKCMRRCWSCKGGPLKQHRLETWMRKFLPSNMDLTIG